MRLPVQYSKSVDFWGYYNGKANKTSVPTQYYYPNLVPSERVRLYRIPGYTGARDSVIDADRTPDTTLLQTGVLNKIQYPGGGSTTIQYQSNRYYDPVTTLTYPGGGLRVFKITYFDGLRSDANVVKYYTYTDSTGKCSGRLMQRPVFSIPTEQYRDAGGTPYLQSGWSYLMVRTEDDISPGETTQGSPVGYGEVKVARPGAGTARYEYLMPAAYGAYSAPSWTPSWDKYARSSSSSPLGPVTVGGGWLYPYAPNPDVDIERGLVKRKRDYNAAGTLVRWTQDYYQSIYKNGSSIASVYGLLFEPYTYGTSTYLFSKYALHTDYKKELQKERIFIYDENNSAKVQTTTSEYVYGSAYHRLLTQQKQTTHDGTIYSSYFKYPLDYGTIPSGSDTTSAMIGSLVSAFRNGNPIEKYSTIKRGAGTEMVTTGALLRYNAFGTSNIFVSKTYGLMLQNPIPLTGTSPTPFAVSSVNPTSKTFVMDPNYHTTLKALVYDAFGNLESKVAADRIVNTTVYGYSNSYPTVRIRNALASQAAFIDFESPTDMDFSYSGGTGINPYRNAAHTGGYSYYPAFTLSRTVSKATVSNYVLSFWINSTSSISFSVVLRNPSTGVQIGSTITCTPLVSGGNSFKFYQKIIPVTAVTTSTFTVELLASSLSTTPTMPNDALRPLIDDVAFYPETADLTSSTYQRPYGIASTTAGNQTSYTVYDDAGRKKYIKDTYNNIVEKDTYHYASDPVPVLSCSIDLPFDGVHEGSNSFEAGVGNCIEGSTFEWKVDGGSYTAGTSVQHYSFSTVGPHTVYLRATNAIYGVATTSETFSVSMNPCFPSACAAGASVVLDSGTGTSRLCAMSGGCTASAPGNLTGTAFGVVLDDGETISSYQWQLSTNGGPWGNVSTASTYSIAKINPGGKTYQVRCNIVTTIGRPGVAGPTTVTVTTSTITCP